MTRIFKEFCLWVYLMTDCRSFKGGVRCWMLQFGLYDHRDTRHGLRERRIWLPTGMSSGVRDLRLVFHKLSIHFRNLHPNSRMQYL